MTSFTYMDPAGRVIIQGDETPGAPRVLEVRGGSAELTTEMLGLLGYHCALYYRQRTGRTFLPAGMTIAPPAPDEDLIG